MALPKPATACSMGCTTENPYSIIDANGCTFEDTATVNLKVEIFAGFEPSPTSGDTPLEAFFENQSHGANGYIWQTESEVFSSSENPYHSFSDTGTFTVQQITYLGEPWCSDTATATITTFPGINIVVPNIFSPNDDGRNDELVARLFGVTAVQWSIYNRWGNLLYSGSSDDAQLYMPLWDGHAADGTQAPEGGYTLTLQLQGTEGRRDNAVVQVSLVR